MSPAAHPHMAPTSGAAIHIQPSTVYSPNIHTHSQHSDTSV
ncbi:hypothetical protein CGRA01v4_14788 [Colletotrichum graminicola]|nr:hypothetical protein CGRA01v4_14788 [Colletotrichum graminicola]